MAAIDNLKTVTNRLINAVHSLPQTVNQDADIQDEVDRLNALAVEVEAKIPVVPPPVV